ncbi:MAG: tRNA(Ile)-lysidine synthase [Humisphaera sp.]|nr:tRNA(Ile)-lysidine synthase [Humisphaera sp.]
MRTATASEAIASSPPSGRWAVGVSGGADSVALLELLRGRSDLTLVVAHFDHETRAGASAADATFVQELAAQWSLPCIVARRSEIEHGTAELSPNRSARYRAARLEFFRQVIHNEKLEGVVLAHHADDQAETVMQRLLRGSGPGGLVAMRAEAIVSDVRIIRPLLGVRRAALRELLAARGVAWREDASNDSPDQQRNRVRAILSSRPALRDALAELAETSGALVEWLKSQGPTLGETFDVRALQRLSLPVAREAARRWLAARAPAGEEIPAAAADRLVQMACDAASPARQHFPGRVLVRRRAGEISAQP